MGYFSDSRRNWAGAFWVATAIPLVLDPSNPIWDESGWCEEQFGAPYAPLGPSGGNYYFTPNFWAGRGSETVGRRGPRTSLKVTPIIRGTCGAQSSNLIFQKNVPWTPSLKVTKVMIELKSAVSSHLHFPRISFYRNCIFCVAYLAILYDSLKTLETSCHIRSSHNTHLTFDVYILRKYFPIYYHLIFAIWSSHILFLTDQLGYIALTQLPITND